MARHCVRWASGKKRSRKGKRRGHKRHCRFGVVRTGRRKGQCLKSRRSGSRRSKIRRQEAKMWKDYMI